MSVAFRRDSDEEHLEPKFDIPIAPGPNLVTVSGLEQIRARVSGLETALLSETDDSRIAVLKRDLRYWHTRQSTAVVAPVPDGGQVAFGCRVSFTLHNKTRSISIVGDDEADPARDLLSFSAPLVRAMMGAEIGECVAFAGHDDAIEILGIAVVQGAD